MIQALQGLEEKQVEVLEVKVGRDQWPSQKFNEAFQPGRI